MLSAGLPSTHLFPPPHLPLSPSSASLGYTRPLPLFPARFFSSWPLFIVSIVSLTCDYHVSDNRHVTLISREDWISLSTVTKEAFFNHDNETS